MLTLILAIARSLDSVMENILDILLIALRWTAVLGGIDFLGVFDYIQQNRFR